MRVLSIRQPWASLIMIGAKPFEFRSWPLRVAGERWAVHASASWRRGEIGAILGRLDRGYTEGMDPDKARTLLVAVLVGQEHLPTGAILGTVLGGQAVPASTIWDDADDAVWANPVSDPRMLAEPIPVKGRLGWWRYDGALP